MDEFWLWSQSPLGATIVGGVVVLIVGAIAAAIYRKVSGRSIWAGVVKAAKWVGGLRLTTQETREQAHERGRAGLQAEIDARRSRPVLKPQWMLGRDLTVEGEYLIVNSAKGAVAKDVELEASTQMFTFIGAPRWDNLTGEATAVFKGFVSHHGGMFGVDVTVSWTDEHGERWVLENVPIHNTKRSLP